MKKIKKYLSLILAVVLIFNVMPMNALATQNEFLAGTGTESDPYLISTKEHLNNVRNYPEAYFKMVSDITFVSADFAEAGWTPIKSFKGCFDGNGYSIINMKIAGNGFIETNEGAIINLKMKGTSVSASMVEDYSISNFVTYSGAMVYVNGGLIRNCHITGDTTVTSDISNYFGGITGINAGIIRESSNQENISFAEEGTECIAMGGIAGINFLAIYDCYNSGQLIADINEDCAIGGIAVLNRAYVVDCYNVGEIDVYADGGSDSYFGGIVAYNESEVLRCYNAGTINTYSEVGSDTGGIVGYNESIVENCYNTGEIIANFNYGYVAGIAASNGKGKVISCYNIGKITSEIGDSNYVRGIACYGTVEKSYYLEDSSYGISDYGVSCSDEELKLQSTYSGFDFDNVWVFDENFEYEYPQIGSNLQEDIAGFTLLSKPNNTEFTVGLHPDLTGGRVKISYANGNEVETDLKEYMVPELYTEEVSSQTVAVKYGSYDTGETITFTVKEKELASIAVTTLPTKTNYVQGQAMDLTGGVLTLYYNNNTSETISLSNAEVSYNQNQIGEVPVTVTYQGCSTNYNVTFNERIIESIVVNSPTKLTYGRGEELNLTGGSLNVVFESEDEYCEVVPLTTEMISGYDNTVSGIQTLTVTYGGKTTTFVVNVLEDTLASIEVSNNPNKTTYLEGKETFDATGGTILLNYESGYTSTVDLTNDMISGFDNTKVGANTLTVTYQEKTTTFNVEIVAKSLERIEVVETPDKLVYLESKEQIDVTGGKIKLYYNNDTTDEIDLTESMITDFDNTQPGTSVVTVTYQEKTTTFNVNITAKSLTSIEVVSVPSKLTYIEMKETFVADGGKLKLYYNNGTTEEIDMTKDMVSGFDNTMVGTNTLTVTYQEKTDTFDVEILEKTLERIEVTKTPTKVVYMQGANKLDVSGGKITLYYNNDTTEEITMTDDMISGFSSETVGTQSITVTYLQKNASFSVRITNMAVSAESVTAKKGGTIKVPIVVDNNSGFTYLKLSVAYDTSVFELVDVENQGIVEGSFTTSQQMTDNPYVLLWAGTEDSTNSGCIAVLTFKVLEDADVGEHVIDISCEEAYDGNLDDVVFEINDATIDVQEYITGDMNDDCVVDGKDSTLLMRYLAGWDIEIDEKSMDVNGDGEVNGKDSLHLLKYLAGWDVTLG